AEAQRAMSAAYVARYEPAPLGIEFAREAISSYYAGRGDSVAPGDVALTAGTSESIAHLIRLLADPGDTLLAPSPGYPLFAPIAQAEGVRLAPYSLRHDDAWGLDRDSLTRGLDAGARAVLLVEPNHPTGTRISANDWGWLDGEAARRGVALIVDEVFGDYRWGSGSRAFASRAGANQALTFVLSGISKVCGLPQLKLGWIAVAGPDGLRRAALERLEWIADLFLSVATPVQLALPRLLASRHVFQGAVRHRARVNRALIHAVIEGRAGIRPLNAEGGWGAVLELPASRDDEDWALALLDRGVAAHPGHFYDLEGGSF